MPWIISVLLFLTCYEACVIVPQPVILFPFNAEYQTRDIKNRTTPGIPSGVSLAPGPYGEEDGSYEFFGNASSFIEFPNSPGGALDVRYSMTILCWVYYDENGKPDGPIFNYNTGGRYGVHFWVLNRLFYARFNDRAFTYLPYLHHTSLAGGWKFVGASYDNETGEIKLWADGALKQTRKTNAGMELATQGSVRMGFRNNDDRLKNHVTRTIENINEDFCGALCFMEYNCVSFNVKVTGGPGTSTICELNNSTHHANLGDLQTLENSIYHGITENPCDEPLCQHSSTCQAGFTDKGYRCLCGSGFCGEHCETAGSSCKNIKAIIGEEAINGRYFLIQDGVKFEPVILFPLNAEYQTNDIKDRTAPGIPSGVSLAPGPYGEEDGSYEFFGNANSFIEFPNSPGGTLDVRYSMTILCWVYYDENGGPHGPIFDYNTGGKYGVHLWVVNRLFYARFNDRVFSNLPLQLYHTSLAGGWKFVGASYDNETGEIKLWVDGALKQTRNMGARVELATQGNVRMGVREKANNWYFKGKISQLQIYDVPLSQSQILELRKKPEEPCRHLEFISDNIFQGYSLKNHVIRTIQNINEDFCGALCFMEYNCVSFNVKVTGGPGTSTICELNNSTHHANLGDLQTLQNSIYHGITVNPCDESLCQHSSTCQAGFTDKGYRCLCGSGFCAGNSCKNIKEIIGEEAINGSYFLIQDGVKFEVCW
ncbi:hypothetical protein P5673_031636 [Acropora cervicornis]|uniref:EGF-like domain-containing protein n=1 Tax=Acropora cervicornis TaxID=6130 RepID=A0AAD9PST0_ACRCE|nr:hypothetical protein P5673_031636 [Acropora cervicornis]